MKNMEEWFDQQDWNQGELPQGHRDRFLQKLDVACDEVQATAPVSAASANGKVVKLNAWLKYAAVAAIVLLLGLTGMQVYNQPAQQTGLASVSPEMAQAQSFFTTTIDRELAQLNDEMSPETERIITDARAGLKKLATEYQSIIKDFKVNQDSQAVIAAMIENFQSRIDLLEVAQEQINQLKQLKEKQDEDII